MSTSDRAELLFAKGDLRNALQAQCAKAVEKIRSLDANYLLKVSETDLARTLEQEFRVEPLKIQRDGIYAEEPRETEIEYSGQQAWRYGESHVRVPGFLVRVIVPFDGDAGLLRLTPQTYDLNPPRAEIQGQELHFEYRSPKLDPQAVKKLHDDTLARIETCIERGQPDVDAHNEQINSVITSAIRQRKAKLLENMNAVAAIGIPVRQRSTPPTYAVPSVRRKPKIELPQVPAGAYKPEPTLATEDYEFILKVVQDVALVIERSPSAFASMGEEHLRTHFLFQLNGHFQGAATGETFNASGKTDILIRIDNRNVFIAECKFWRGDKVFTATIDQLLGYLSWRDTKAALLVFNRNRDMTRVVEKIPALVKAHPNFKRALPQSGETQFRYILGQRDDPNRELVLTIMVFSIPSESGVSEQ